MAIKNTLKKLLIFCLSNRKNIMVSALVRTSFYSVAQYPADLLRVINGSVQVPVTYKKSWDDGFGARGWKVDAAIGDPEIIASTRDTGQRINTSVFVHDILDHYLSGFGVSGHRSEAMALIQLFKRTGSSPVPDYEQMAREDILNGRVNGEKLYEFLPADLSAMLPKHSDMTNKELMAYLKDKLGEKRLISKLVDNFLNLGKAGEDHADASWKVLNLDINRRSEIGVALQSLLDVIDLEVEKSGLEVLRGFIMIRNDYVAFTMPEPPLIGSIEGYQVAVSR